jgi:hypothetical protein
MSHRSRFETLAAACLELPVHHSRADALRAALAMPGDQAVPASH